MPGWHAATVDMQESGDLAVLGIVIEQHPDRARLFMQWQQMGWPLLVDALDTLDMPLVPATVLLDEHGVVRRIQSIGYERVDSRQAVEEHLAADHAAPDEVPAPRTPPDLEALRARAEQGGDAAAWRALGDWLFLSGDESALDDAVAAYREAVELDPADGAAWFRLGVSLRHRYDVGERQPGDFRRAVEAWSRALAIDPNNYIWRRRLQQYGPRLPKPYPFYDWVEQARRDIRERGETPVTLQAEPGGAEVAAPAERFEPVEGAEEPDPEGRIHRDDGTFVIAESAVVPPRVAPGDTARVHVDLRPNLEREAHWNNEAEDTVVWLEAPGGYALDQRHHVVPRPPELVSTELRRVEVEVQVPADAAPGTATLGGYALVYVCEDIDGVCLYRRRDLSVPITVGRPGSAPDGG